MMCMPLTMKHSFLTKERWQAKVNSLDILKQFLHYGHAVCSSRTGNTLLILIWKGKQKNLTPKKNIKD